MASRKKDVSAPPKKTAPRRPRAITKADLDAALAPLARREDHPTHEQHRAAIAEALTNHPTHEQHRAAIAEALKDHPTHEQHRAATAEAIAPLATKAELAAAIAPLATKSEMHAAFEAFAHRFREVMNQDLARHIGAAMEEMRGWIRALDDKYADLPPRVSALEARLDGK